MKLYTCCPYQGCGAFQKALSFLHGWGIEPEIGLDEDGHFFGFDIPRKWSRRRKRAFQAALEPMIVPFEI